MGRLASNGLLMCDVFLERWEVERKFIKKTGGRWEGGLGHDFQTLTDTRFDRVKTKIKQHGEMKNWDSSEVSSNC